MAAQLNSRAQVAAASFVLFCAALFLTAFSARNPYVSRLGFVVVAEVQRPFQSLYSGAVNSLVALWEDYLWLIGVRQENRTLKARLLALEADNSRLIEFADENRRLRDLLQIGQLTGHRGVAANVVGYDPTNWSQTILLDRGSKDDIQPGMPVLVGQGVVGQIIAASYSTARALLITDPSSGIDAILQGSRVRGVVQGVANINSCELLYVQRDEEVKVGDRIITSGMDDVFPKGLLIGIVSEVGLKRSGMFQSVEVKPAVDFRKLENALIVHRGEGEN